MQTIFFQSSLPRSGSTLLQNILAQNPDFYTTPTSGLLELLFRSRNAYSDSPEFKAQDQEIMKKAFLGYCKGALEGYFNGITDKKFIVDKCRAWGINYECLNMFYKNPKIVCMIRDPKDIFTSMEKKHRQNPHINSGIVNNAELKGTTVEKRIDIWANNVPVGISLDWLKDIIYQGIHNNILFVKFEHLTANPQNELNRIYDFFEIERFNHNFNNVEQSTQEDDTVHGIFGDHKIRQIVKPVESQANEILGSNICNWIENNYKWFYEVFKY
jgi:sulfotransferase